MEEGSQSLLFALPAPPLVSSEQRSPLSGLHSPSPALDMLLRLRTGGSASEQSVNSEKLVIGVPCVSD